jgi:cyclic pyranopterin monophosphate synthase
MSQSNLSHFNSAGEAHMVDVGDKAITQRTAICEGMIEMLPNTLGLIMAGNHKKGDVLGIARIAGIMASKKTADLIPLCHPLPLTHVEIQLQPQPESCRVHCLTTVKTNGQTGVEMEALMATQIGNGAPLKPTELIHAFVLFAIDYFFIYGFVQQAHQFCRAIFAILSLIRLAECDIYQHAEAVLF